MLEGFAGPLPFSGEWHEVLLEAFFSWTIGLCSHVHAEKIEWLQNLINRKLKPCKSKAECVSENASPLCSPLPPTLAQSLLRDWLCA